jgi:rubrerythrin
MKIKFNPEQAYLVAKRIEENGAAFYRRAADFVDDPEKKKLLLSLADWEGRHIEFFESLRNDISDIEPMEYTKYIDRLFKPDADTEVNIREWADSAIFSPDESPVELLTGNETLEDILRIALRLEKDAVVFYTGLKEVMNVTKESDALNKIIREEMRHISVLTHELNQCRLSRDEEKKV